MGPTKNRTGPPRAMGSQCEPNSGAVDEREWWRLLQEPLPETVGPEHLPALNIGLQHLWAELRQAQSEYRAGRESTGAYLSLIAVGAFLSLFGATWTEGLGMPLSALESALWALDEGIVEPILTPPRPAKAGRAPSSALKQELRGAAVYVLRRLMDFGLSRSAAEQAVADDLRRIGVRPDRGRGPGRLTRSAVRAWCEEVAADIGRRRTATRRYRLLLADPTNKALDGMPADDAVKLLRHRLIAFAAAVNPPKPPS
jgi:hypothetical protein